MLFKEMFDCSGNGLPPFLGSGSYAWLAYPRGKQQKQEKATFRSDESSIQ